MCGLLGGFERGIAFEGVAIFDDFDGIGEVIERDDTKSPRREQLSKFIAFLAIVRADNEREMRIERHGSDF